MPCSQKSRPWAHDLSKEVQKVMRLPRAHSGSYPSSDKLNQQVKRNQMHDGMNIVVQHDWEIRELEAWSCNTFLLGWKAKIPESPESGTLPKGPRWRVAGTANMLVTDPLGKFVAHHEAVQSVEDMEGPVQLAKETRNGKVLRTRPTKPHRCLGSA
eukprot:s1183_g2.t1